MPKINYEKRLSVIQKADEGISQRRISIELNISRKGVQNILKKHRTLNIIENLPKSGPKKKYSERDVRLLVRMSKANPFYTARDLRNRWKNLSVETVKKILQNNKLFGRIATKKPFLNKKQIKKRMDWATEYGNWTNNQWSRVIFSDECCIQTKPTTRAYVRRLNGQRFLKPYTIKTVKHGGKSLMVWGAIKANGDRILIKLLCNADSIEYQRILNEGLLPFYDTDDIFQHDGAPCHRSKSTGKFLTMKGICAITDWPPQSPDCNIIENMWSELKKLVSKHKIKTTEDLWSITNREWFNIPNTYITRLYESIPQRLLIIRKNKGGNTSY